MLSASTRPLATHGNHSYVTGAVSRTSPWTRIWFMSRPISLVRARVFCRSIRGALAALATRLCRRHKRGTPPDIYGRRPGHVTACWTLFASSFTK